MDRFRSSRAANATATISDSQRADVARSSWGRGGGRAAADEERAALAVGRVVICLPPSPGGHACLAGPPAVAGPSAVSRCCDQSLLSVTVRGLPLNSLLAPDVFTRMACGFPSFRAAGVRYAKACSPLP